MVFTVIGHEFEISAVWFSVVIIVFVRAILCIVLKKLKDVVIYNSV